MKKTDLHEYQRRGVRFIKDNPYCALFLSMGLGKSITTLTAIQELIDECEVERVLVIAPKKVAESTWSAEVEKWNHLGNLTVSVILGDARKREEALQRDAEIYVTSRDLFPWIAAKYLGASGQPLRTKPWPWGMVVIDELTSFKSSTSKRFKMFRKLRPYMQRVVGLTGTPTPNGLKDLWGQMYCIDMGRSLGQYKTQFINTYFNTYAVGGVIMRMTPKPDAEKAITARIRDHVLTMKAKDYLELPPMIEETRWVTLSDKTRKMYDEFERECVLQFNEADKPIAVAANAAVLCGKLLQYCNGAIYQEDDQTTVIQLHDEKLEAAMEIIEAAMEEGSNILVFYEFRHDVERIMSRCPKGTARKYETDQDLRDWNAGKIPVLLAHPASTAYGLNLQKGGHLILWYGTGWNAELYEQGNARLARQGQEMPVVVYRLVCRDTMDERALQAVSGKVKAQDAMINALKAKK